MTEHPMRTNQTDGSCLMAPMLAGEAGNPVHRTQGAEKPRGAGQGGAMQTGCRSVTRAEEQKPNDCALLPTSKSTGLSPVQYQNDTARAF